MASRSASPFALPPEENPSTHAGRNPSQPQQKTRVLSRPSLSNAQKASRALRLTAVHETAEELATDLDTLLTRHRAELDDFAKEHSTKQEYIQKLISQSSHYKQKRAVTIQNAKLHAKSLEVNGGTCPKFICIEICY
jgi:hypothetical protein